MSKERARPRARGLIGAACLLGLVAASAIGASGVAPLASGGPASIAAATSGQMQYTSNWSGYVATANVPFTLVSSHWIEPTVYCVPTPNPQAAAFWVGLDGWGSQTVEQGGTITECYGLTPVHYMVWEMYNFANAYNSATKTLIIHAGDAMAASVSFKGGLFYIAVTDLTTKQILRVTQACTTTCARISAEWIAEAPSYGATIAYLPRWSPAINFYPDQASTLPALTPSYLGAFANFPVTMTGLIGPRAAPTALGPLGRGFHDTWLTEAP